MINELKKPDSSLLMILMIMKGLILILLCVTMFSCTKTETGPEAGKKSGGQISASAGGNQAAPHGDMGGMPQEHPVDMQSVSNTSQTIVPDIVRESWKGVKLILEDKKKSVKREQSVNLGESIKLEGNLTVHVEAFLPDLKIEDGEEGAIYTSYSNNLENPAVKIQVIENDEQIFNGWLFALFPEIHSFNHDEYGITFKEAIPKK